MNPPRRTGPAPSAPAGGARRRLVLIHGNDETAVNNARFELQRALLPNGEADGEVVDIRGPGTQPLKLERCIEEIIQELGTVSLLGDARRVVVVWDLVDLRTARKGSARDASKKKATATESALRRLDDYVTRVLPTTGNTLVLVHLDDDEKNRRVEKTSALYELATRLGEVKEFSEKRIDWQFEDAFLGRDLGGAIALLREWQDRGGNASFRALTTINRLMQLVLQARLQDHARHRGANPSIVLLPSMRTSLKSVPDFKARKIVAFSQLTSLERVKRVLGRLNDAQRAFYPTGEELIVHDPWELLEFALVEAMTADR